MVGELPPARVDQGAVSLVDAGTLAWFVAIGALLILQQFSAPGARAARTVLAPVVVLLGGVFAWKVVTVFAPILGFELR